MQSPNRVYVPELDQLRAFAAVLVLYYHSVWTGRSILGYPGRPWANIFDALLLEGHTGVALFMVLSGFVLARGAVGSAVNYRSFIYNRILRIFPMMSLLVLFAIYANKGVDLQGIVSPFLLLFNTQPRFFPDVTNLTGTIWTISVEFQFYIVAPFIFAFVGRNGWQYLLGAILLAFLLRCLALFPHRDDGETMYIITYYTIVGRLTQFLVGVALAYSWHWISDLLSERRATCFGILFAAFAAIVLLSMRVSHDGGNTVWHPWMIVYREVEAMIWATVLVGYVLARPLRGWPRIAQAVTEVGVVSYSVYLLHWPIERDFWSFVAAQGWGPTVPTLPVLFVYATMILAITLATSVLSYSVVEKPFLTLRKRYITDHPIFASREVPSTVAPLAKPSPTEFR